MNFLKNLRMSFAYSSVSCQSRGAFAVVDVDLSPVLPVSLFCSFRPSTASSIDLPKMQCHSSRCQQPTNHSIPRPTSTPTSTRHRATRPGNNAHAAKEEEGVVYFSSAPWQPSSSFFSPFSLVSSSSRFEWVRVRSFLLIRLNMQILQLLAEA